MADLTSPPWTAPPPLLPAACRPGTLVSYETTLPVGTTRQRLALRWQRVRDCGPVLDFALCHSPERVSSGRVFADLRRYPKLVGGIDACERRAGIAPSTPQFSTSTNGPICHARTAYGISAAPRRPS